MGYVVQQFVRFGASLLVALALVSPVDAGDSAAQRAEAIDALFTEYTQPGSPGLAVGVAVAGKPVYMRGFGLANLDDAIAITPATVFHVASVSKQFTAFAIALLELEGRVNVAADIHEYLPELPDFGARIAVRDLIHHTSGLKDQWALLILAGHDWSDVLSQREILALIARNPILDFAPGSDYAYSNTNYTLLAEIVARVSGMSFREFMQQRVFHPLGMTQSFIYDDVREVVPRRAQSYTKSTSGQWQRYILSYDTWGATSMHTTVADLLKWGGNLVTPTVGSAALIEHLSTPARLANGRQLSYAYGLNRDVLAGRAALSHSGHDAAFYSYFVHFPEERTTVVILSNTGPARRQTANDVARAWFGGDGPLVPAKRKGQRDAAYAEDALGTYIGGPDDSVFKLVMREQRWEWQPLTEARGRPLRPTREGAEQIEHDIAYRIVRGKQGDVVGIEETVRSNPFVTDRWFYRRAPLPNPSGAELAAALTGVWRSDSLDVSYVFSVKEGQLEVSDLWGRSTARFIATEADRFDSTGGSPLRSLTVERDAHGAVTDIVTAGRTRGIRFRRIPVHFN